MKKKLSKDEKRLATLALETEKQKKALIEQLKKTPIVQTACTRADVGRATYYKWRAQDRVFARVAERAIEFSRFSINDVAESRLLQLVQSDNLTAIIFWLKHNHPQYAPSNKVIHEFQTAVQKPSIEEIRGTADELGKIFAAELPPKLTTKERIEHDMEEAERNEPDRKRMEALFEDPSENEE